MHIRALIFAPIALASTISYADLSLVSSSVSGHPSVVEKANEITHQGIVMDQIIAENGLKINLSSRSKLSLINSLDLNKTRASNLDDNFIDGVFTLEKNLYDFGVVDNKINAEKYRKSALKLEYFEVFEKVLKRLLNTVNDVSRVGTLLSDLGSTIATTKNSIEDINLRFSSGIGTVMEVRQAQLLLLDLETEAQNLQRENNTKLAILKDEFGITEFELSVIDDAISDFIVSLRTNHQLVSNVISSDIEYKRSLQLIDLEESALYSEINALKSENMPQINMSATTVFYDVSHRGLNEYEIYGGVNITMPLFDSGLSSVKKRRLLHRIEVQDVMVDALNQDKFLVLNKLTKSYQNLQIEYNNAQLKLTNLNEKLSQIILRMAVVDESLLTKLQTQLELAKFERNILSYPYHLRSLNIDYWALNERLMEKINITPPM